MKASGPPNRSEAQPALDEAQRIFDLVSVFIAKRR